jgi:hypothetical protein
MPRLVSPVLLISMALLAGCASESEDTVASSPSESRTAVPSPSPTRATVAALPGAPTDTAGLGGHVLLSPDRTAVTLELSGLEPAATYMAHVHESACADNSGGAHFKFDPTGSDAPPNEVHFPLTASQDGTATATETPAQPLPDGARSVVVHSDGTKMACADLPASR